MPNVHFLGLKPNEQLPQYLAHFDACLNLFAKSDLSKDVSPLKFYEYLATGRPIVSTKQPDQILQYAPLTRSPTARRNSSPPAKNRALIPRRSKSMPALRQAAPVLGIAVSRRCAAFWKDRGFYEEKIAYHRL